jgi:hypothetical protein
MSMPSTCDVTPQRHAEVESLPDSRLGLLLPSPKTVIKADFGILALWVPSILGTRKTMNLGCADLPTYHQIILHEKSR